MQTHLVTAPQPMLPRHMARTARPEAAPQDGPAARSATDRDFLAMLGQCRASGGLARAAEVVTCLERGFGRDAGLLARWRAERSVICFEWQAQVWLPRFQFASVDMLPIPAVRMVLDELSLAFDEVETAQWFCAPNSALDGGVPVDALGEGLAVVLAAARVDRFAANARGPATN